MDNLAELTAKFLAVWPLLDERTRRLLAASEAIALGDGGVSVVQRACGLSRKAIANGIREIEAGTASAPGRIRRLGAGRKASTVVDPRLVETLEAMIDAQTRGDPESPLRWICQSTRTIAKALGGRHHPVSHTKVAQLLHGLDYSLQSNRKTEEGRDHPDRDAQFRHINATVTRCLARRTPVISVDTKKKELVGNFHNAGQQWRPAKRPRTVRTHDFPTPDVPRAYPYGIYDIGRNTGFVNVEGCPIACCNPDVERRFLPCLVCGRRGDVHVRKEEGTAMKKPATRETPCQPHVEFQLPLPLLSCLQAVREGFFELCIHVGEQAWHALMEQDRPALCGARWSRDPSRRAGRGGSTASEVTLGGRRIRVRRLRAAQVDGPELALPSFGWAADRDPLDEHTWRSIVAGVSTRSYGASLAPVPNEFQQRSTARSAVSRRFVALRQRPLTTGLSRPLGDLDLQVVMIDGIDYHDHTILVALGIDARGTKHVLGVREGTTENSAVAGALLSDVVDRGLAVDQPLLFVIAGGTALRKAIRRVFGAVGVVQRCQVHCPPSAPMRQIAGIE